MVKQLTTLSEFKGCIGSAEQALVVVDFTAKWCKPCQGIAPLYESLAKEYPQAVFTKVDVDENKETAQDCGVSSMPTFLFFKRGALVHKIAGADAEGLKRAVQEHAGDKWSVLQGGVALAGSGDVASDPRGAAAAAAAARMETAGPASAAPADADEEEGTVKEGETVQFGDDWEQAVGCGSVVGAVVFGDFDDEAVDLLDRLALLPALVAAFRGVRGVRVNKDEAAGQAFLQRVLGGEGGQAPATVYFVGAGGERLGAVPWAEWEGGLAQAARAAKARAAKPAPAPRPSMPTPPASASASAALQLRLFGGDTMRRSFAASAPLREVFDVARRDGNAGAGGFVLMQAFPRLMLSEEEHGEATLQALGLTPSATLILTVHPNSKGRGGGDGGGGGGGGGGGWLSWVSSLWGGGQQQQGGDSDEGAAQAPGQPARAGGQAQGVTTLASMREGEGEADGRRQDFWNGNSTAFQQ